MSDIHPLLVNQIIPNEDGLIFAIPREIKFPPIIDASPDSSLVATFHADPEGLDGVDKSDHCIVVARVAYEGKIPCLYKNARLNFFDGEMYGNYGGSSYTGSHQVKGKTWREALLAADHYIVNELNRAFFFFQKRIDAMNSEGCEYYLNKILMRKTK